MIELRNVTKFYHLEGGGRHYVVKNLSLDIPPNKNIAILGPNGAGKSTLLRMIGGAEAPNSGTIESKSNISWPLGVSAGFQGSLTGRENVNFVCKINGLTKEQTLATLEAVQEFAEIGDFFDQRVKTYSSGMRARVAFGLSIIFDFDYYLIDELTAVGDASFRKKAQIEFAKIKERASLVFVSHNLQMLLESCDAAILLKDGEGIYYQDIKEGIKAYELLLPPSARKITNKKTKNPKPAKKRIAATLKKLTATKERVAKKRAAIKRVAKKRAAIKQKLQKDTELNNAQLKQKAPQSLEGISAPSRDHTFKEK